MPDQRPYPPSPAQPARHLLPFKERVAEVVRVAESLYRQSPDWITFFREIFGVDGAARQAFSRADELRKFELTPACAGIHDMVARLRANRCVEPDEKEPERVITVRLPVSIHQYLRAEAQSLGVSMNKLCIVKLVKIVDDGPLEPPVV